jgi:hypothetical protein
MAATITRAIIEELLELVLFVRSVSGIYNEDQLPLQCREHPVRRRS